MKNHCRWLLPCAATALLTLAVQTVKATPYASCVTNNNGTIQFYINESGGNVTVTYEDGSTNENFNGQTTGVNLNAGGYSFSLTDNSILHTSYVISVYKQGAGVPSVINSPIQNANSGSGFFIIGDLRGIDVNKNPTSPNFGRIYISASARTAPAEPFYSFRGDGSFWSSNSAGITFTAGNASSPYRIGVAPDDSLMVGDLSSAGAGIWRVSPDLFTSKLFLGPLGDQITNSAGAIVHGEIFSRPLVIGTLTNNGVATLMEVDNDFPSTQPYSILIFTNVMTNALPYETPPIIGPEVGLNFPGLGNVYPGLTQGTNGYIYASEQRANYAIPDMDIYDGTGTNLLWTSQPNAGQAPDYFVTDSGNGLQGLIDSAVSPDSAFLVGMAIDNHFTICSLTNGIPDVRTFYAVAPTSYAINGRGVCWDAADNIYSISSGTAWVQAWTLGLTTTAVTTGNANGLTGFQVVYPPDQISVTASNAVISQPNPYGNLTSTFFVLNRAGPPTNAITVGYKFSGTAVGATNGGVSYPAEFTANPPSSVTFDVGQTQAIVVVTATSDSIPRPTTSLTLTLSSGSAYLPVTPKAATISVLNTAPQELLTSAGSTTMYNGYSGDYCSMQIVRWGDVNQPQYTVSGSSFSVLSGTAVEGTDYTVPSAVVFHVGDLTNYSYVYPLVGGAVPVHTNVMTYTGNKSAVLSLQSGTGYTALANTNAFTIVDSAYPAAPVLYYDPLTNSAPTNWIVRPTDENYPNTVPDYFADFGYNLANDVRDPDTIPISTPPNGQPTALRVTTGKSGTVGNQTTYSTGVNLYLTNSVFSGNYAVRVNMNITEANSFATQGSFEGPLFGIDFSGNQTNWYLNSSPSAPLNTSGSQTNYINDGVFVWLTDNQFSQYDPYTLFAVTGTNSPKAITPTVDTAYSTFANNFKTSVFQNAISGLPANGSPDNSLFNPPFTNLWADVEMKQYVSGTNAVIRLSINKTPILVYTGPILSGTVMLGYETPVFGGDGADGAVYYSDLKVVQLTPPAVSQPKYNLQTSKLTFTFTTPDGSVTPSSFQVVGATALNGPYTAVAGVTITQVSTPGIAEFQATVPTSGAVHFYRLQLSL